MNAVSFIHFTSVIYSLTDFDTGWSFPLAHTFQVSYAKSLLFKMHKSSIG